MSRIFCGGDIAALVVGRDYYFQHADGRATLKRLKMASSDRLVLSAVNRKYDDLHITRNELARAARVWTRIDRPYERAAAAQAKKEGKAKK